MMTPAIQISQYLGRFSRPSIFLSLLWEMSNIFKFTWRRIISAT